MSRKTRALLFAVASPLALLAGCVGAALLPSLCPWCVIVGVAGYVECGRRAVVLWRLDERVFDHPHRHFHDGRHPVPMVAVGLLLGSLTSVVLSHGVLSNRP